MIKRIYFIFIIFNINIGEEINLKPNIEKITLGAGCFWCIEAIYNNLEGVIDVQVGYTGGASEYPTYEEVCTGKSGHIEVAQISYDMNYINLKQILDVFWKSHDPTSIDRQGADIGSQYRSAIFYHNNEQKLIIEKSKLEVNNSSKFVDPIVTKIYPLKEFYYAEAYHQDYYKLNSNAPYCKAVIKPKIIKLFGEE